MPWFKVDDTFAMHEKVMAAGNAAVGLWTRAGAWSMQQLTDGFVPDSILRVLGTPKERRTLVEVSLWDEAEGGIQFRNWEERQPTKEQVENARAAAAERQRHARERAKSRRDSQRDSQRSDSVSHGPPDPTRPDPIQDPSDLGADNAAKPKKTGRQLPDDFRPSESHIELAASLGIDLRAEWPKFVDHHKAKGSVMKDWDAALRTWIRNGPKFGGARTPVVVSDPTQLPPVEESWMRRRG